MQSGFQDLAALHRSLPSTAKITPDFARKCLATADRTLETLLGMGLLSHTGGQASAPSSRTVNQLRPVVRAKTFSIRILFATSRTGFHKASASPADCAESIIDVDQTANQQSASEPAARRALSGPIQA